MERGISKEGSAVTDSTEVAEVDTPPYDLGDSSRSDLTD